MVGSHDGDACVTVPIGGSSHSMHEHAIGAFPNASTSSQSNETVSM
jgi:hypothetical protein